jgi:hypothetical protein
LVIDDKARGSFEMGHHPSIATNHSPCKLARNAAG